MGRRAYCFDGGVVGVCGVKKKVRLRLGGGDARVMGGGGGRRFGGAVCGLVRSGGGCLHISCPDLRGIVGLGV